MSYNAIISDILLFELIRFESFQKTLILKNEKLVEPLNQFLNNKFQTAQITRLAFSRALTEIEPGWKNWISLFARDIKKQYDVINRVESIELLQQVDPSTNKTIIIANYNPALPHQDSAKPVVIDMQTRGPVVWKSLHTYALSWDGNVDAQTAFIADTTKQIACGECKQFWLNYKTENPPPTDSKESFFAWTVELHNKVNIKLSKPTMELAAAIGLYKS